MPASKRRTPSAAAIARAKARSSGVSTVQRSWLRSSASWRRSCAGQRLGSARTTAVTCSRATGRSYRRALPAAPSSRRLRRPGRRGMSAGPRWRRRRSRAVPACRSTSASTIAGSTNGQSAVIRTIGPSWPAAAPTKRSRTSSSEPRSRQSPAPARRPRWVVVGEHARGDPDVVQPRARQATQQQREHRLAFAISASTLPGSRVEDIRAWTIASALIGAVRLRPARRAARIRRRRGCGRRSSPDSGRGLARAASTEAGRPSTIRPPRRGPPETGSSRGRRRCMRSGGRARPCSRVHAPVGITQRRSSCSCCSTSSVNPRPR